MMRWALLGALLLVTACGDGDDSGGDTGGELRPADEVIEEDARAEAIDGELGEPVDLDGLVVTVDDVSFAEDVENDGTDSDFKIAVTMRVENPTDEDSSVPEVSVRCADADLEGTWYVDSTLELYAELPAETFDEGDVILGVPLGCEDPVVRVQPYSAITFEGEEPASADWAVPAEALP